MASDVATKRPLLLDWSWHVPLDGGVGDWQAVLRQAEEMRRGRFEPGGACGPVLRRIPFPCRKLKWARDFGFGTETLEMTGREARESNGWRDRFGTMGCGWTALYCARGY